MKADPSHPYIQHLKDIDEHDVLVIDNIARPPLVGEAYIANNLLIIVCHQGAIINDEVQEFALRTHDVSILMPDQIALPKEVTPDLCCTNIAISRKFYKRLLHQYPYKRYASFYRRRPPCLLNEQQFDNVLDAVNLIRTVSCSDFQYRQEYLANLLCILLSMLGEYHTTNYGDETPGTETIFNRFYELLIKFHCESHEMAFYASKCCLSPKYFSELIYRETGIKAKEWISTYVTVRAKTLLTSRKDMTVQQISLFLGFSEQTSFCRFFKSNTGMSPTEYRNLI